MLKNKKIAILGLGYVGLPLAIEFSKKYDVMGFDINHDRITNLRDGLDKTCQVNSDELKVILKDNKSEGNGLYLSSDLIDLQSRNIFIVAVPTPLKSDNTPNLQYLFEVSELIGSFLKIGDIVIYESTVYPGCTEEECVPVLERSSRLRLNFDFFVGYSPERVNPGDKTNTITTIKKVTSGSNPNTAEFVDELYRSIIKAGTYRAPSIRVAEAAKSIENAQRDLNISFVNEISMIFDTLGIDTQEVLAAARTKWNFLDFRPGLVGGHCIGVDPYYLLHKARMLGYNPRLILEGRRVNEHMGFFIAEKVYRLMAKRGITIKHPRVLIMGFTFKENCPDIRNTAVINIYRKLVALGSKVEVFDPLADRHDVLNMYGISMIEPSEFSTYSAIVIAVGHEEFRSFDYLKIKEKKCVIFDTKSLLDKELVDASL